MKHRRVNRIGVVEDTDLSCSELSLRADVINLDNFSVKPLPKNLRPPSARVRINLGSLPLYQLMDRPCKLRQVKNLRNQDKSQSKSMSANMPDKENYNEAGISSMIYALKSQRDDLNAARVQSRIAVQNYLNKSVHDMNRLRYMKPASQALAALQASMDPTYIPGPRLRMQDSSKISAIDESIKELKHAKSSMQAVRRQFLLRSLKSYSRNKE